MFRALRVDFTILWYRFGVAPLGCDAPRFAAHLPWLPGSVFVHSRLSLGGGIFAKSLVARWCPFPWGEPCLRQNRQPLDVRAFKMSLMPKRLNGPEHWRGFQ